ncbi:unnamed protein product [Soboliphyme baturini]|uniref:PDZ domain-containing protein n=1 Tax=Soboliphyme baturini TaxID=241478 RepID=A0A183IIU5_9BILA|nr:unnamed protein product [Soboliphyme baturini]
MSPLRVPCLPPLVLDDLVACQAESLYTLAMFSVVVNDCIDKDMVQRCVIINKDQGGYGLTVSGENPVFVQSVKEDGAAARAGVREGDRIIKVNGTSVAGFNHLEVVKLISAGSYVVLTLFGCTAAAAAASGLRCPNVRESYPPAGNTSSGSAAPTRNDKNHRNSSFPKTSKKIITAPQPLDVRT